MAKKAKKGSSEEEKEQKDKLSEVDKEWYHIQMKSLEEKLARRVEIARNLEMSSKEYQERYEQLREDKADVVAYLKRTLQQRTDQGGDSMALKSLFSKSICMNNPY